MRQPWLHAQGLGKVAELGAGASKFAVGERVVSMEPWKCVRTRSSWKAVARLLPSMIVLQIMH